MSTSDAAELERGAGGGLPDAPPRTHTARSTATREHQDETSGETPPNHRHDEAVREEQTPKAPTLRAGEDSPHPELDAQTWKSHEPRFTPSLLLRLSNSLGLARTNLKSRSVPDQRPPRSIETHRRDNKERSVQVPGGVPFQTSIKTHTSLCDISSSAAAAANEEKKVSPAVTDNEEIIYFEPRETRTSSTEKPLKEYLRDQTELSGESDLQGQMLSSTVVTVLAPHWGSRTRRPKKADGPLSPGAQWSLQDPNSYSGYCGVKGPFTSGSQDPMRVPPLGPRSNTIGWSTKSEPFSLDSRRKITQTTSLDSPSGRMDNQKRDGRAESFLTPMTSAIPPFVPQNEQKGPPQTVHPAHLSPSSSKPTTSSLLLSLRRFNSDGRSPPPLNKSLSDTNGKSFSTHLSQNFLKKNEQERTKSTLSPAGLSSPSNDERHWTPSDTVFFPTSPVMRDAAECPFSKHSQPSNKTQSSFTFRSSTNKEGPDGQKTGTPPLHMDASISSPRHASYSPAPLQKTHSIPRTTLTSTSWWKQVAHEGSRTTTNTTEMPNTPFIQSHHDNRGKLYLNSTDNKGLGSQILSNRENNNTVESLYTGNMNLVMQMQGCPPDLKQRNADYFPSRDSDRIVTQQNHSSLKSRDAQKAQSMPGVLFSNKMSRAPLQSAQHNRDDPFKNDASHSFHSAQSPETFSNSRSSNIHLNNINSNQYQLNSPISPSNKFLRASPSPDFTNPSNSQVFSTVPTTNTNLSFQFPPTSPQSSQSHTSTSSQTRRYSEKNNTSPLGFERSYASLPKLIHPKIASSLMSTISSSTKTKYSASFISSGTNNSSPVSSNSTSTPLASGAFTSVSISSLLTPPMTPVTNSEASPMKGRKMGFHSLERQPKKRTETEVKKPRRVTWHNSVDVKCTEPMKKEKPSSFPSPRSIDSAQVFLTSIKPDNPTIGICPISPPIAPRNSNTLEAKCGKTRSLSSDSGDLASRNHESKKQGWEDSVSFDLQRHDSITQRQERNHLADTESPQIRSHAPLSLPSDFARSYQHRYSSPPYSTLMSSRLAHGECRTLPPRSPLFAKPPHPNYTKPLLGKTDIITAKTTLRAPSPTSTSQSSSLPIQNPPATKVHEKRVIPETEANNNLCNNNLAQLNQPILISNRVSSSPQLSKKVHGSSSAYILEAAAAAASQRPVTQPLYDVTNTVVSGKNNPNKQNIIQPENGLSGFSGPNLSGSCSTDNQLQAGERKMDSFFGKSKFMSLNSNQEQSPKKSWFSLKKSMSTPNASVVRSESERGKSGKMDQVFNRLKQKLSMRQSVDDPSFPRKWRRSSETPSLGGTSDVSNFSDISDDSAKTLEEVQVKEPVDGRKDEDADRWTQNRYTIVPFPSAGGTAPGDLFSSRSHEPPPTSEHKPNSYEDISENQGQHHLRVHSPIHLESNLCKDNRKAPNLLLPCSPCRSPNPSHRKSTPSPRSPFSPFGSLSPHSPLSLTDTADDVFYSPKLNRRKETSSPQPVEGLSLTGSRKSRASTGPPSLGAAPNSDSLDSSYADLKYGIEPGRTFSVSSVLSSRPSGPGRISTGSRFMSVGDLSQAKVSYTGQNSVTSDGTTEVDGQHPTDASYFPSESGQMRTRSLPRSFSRRLANWSSDFRDPQPLSTPGPKPAHLQGADMGFELGTEEPLTPPPTPPLSPVSRRMSKPPGPSPTSLSSSSGSPKSSDSPSSRGLLPSRGYVSSLSTFEESSDSSSDTTTDDEYYLETDDEGEKETEL